MLKNYLKLKRKYPKIKRILHLACIVILTLVSQSNYAQFVQIGSGTSTDGTPSTRIPVSNYVYNYSQQIITANEISTGGGAPGNILSIRYYVSTVGTFSVWNNWKIYLGNSTKTSFSSDTDWVNINSLTQVYSGILSPTPTAGSWYEITFSVPFEYTGDNLIVAVHESTLGWDAAPVFRSYTSTANSGIMYRDDTVNFNTSSPATAYARKDILPQIQLYFEEECMSPKIFTIDNVLNNTAQISWLPTPDASQYDWIVVADNENPETATPITSGTSTTPQAIITSLNSSTIYNLYVRTTCSTIGAESTWSQPVSFTTPCDTFTTPHTQEFSTGTKPLCWTNTSSQPTVANALWKFSGSAEYAINNTRAAGSYAWVDGSDPSNVNDVTLETPPFNVSSLEVPFISFDYFSNKSASSTYPNNVFSVYVNDGTSWELIYTNNTNSPEWRNIEISLTNISSDYIKFKFVVDKTVAPNGFAFYNDILLDNIIVTETPNCVKPLNLSLIESTDSTALLQWVSENTLFNIEYGQQGFTLGDGDVIEGITNPYTLQNLTPNTSYSVYIYTNCGNGDLSLPIGPISFKTSCEDVDEFFENFDTSPTGSSATFTACWKKNGSTSNVYVTTGSGSPASSPNRLNMYSATLTTGANQSFAIMPNVSNLSSGTHRLSFFASTSVANSQLEIGYISNPLDITTFQLLSTKTITTTTLATGLLYYYNPEQGEIPQGVKYLAFRHRGYPSASTIYIDNVTWEVSPPCADIHTLITSNITDESVVISWSTDGDETAWQYVIGDTSVTNPDDLSPEATLGNFTVEILELSPYTSYKVWIRSNCGSGIYGAWSMPITFKTLCTPISQLPWTENFESLTNVGSTIFPDCWLKQNGDWSSSDSTDYNNANSGSKYIRNNWSASNEFIWTPGFQLVGGVSYDLSYYTQGDGYTSWQVSTFFNTSQSSTGATQIEGNYSPTGPGSSQMQQYVKIIKTFVPDSDDVYYFGIRVNESNGNTWYIAFDDFTLEETPPCSSSPSFTLQANSVTSNTAIINWTTPVTPADNGYDYYLTTDPETPDASTIATGSIDGDVNTYTFTDLDSATKYYVYLRTKCSSDLLSDWTLPVSFTTSPSCGDMFYDNGGPNASYSSSIVSTTTISPNQPDSVISVTFLTFNTEANYDGLMIYDGPNTSSPLISSTSPAGSNSTTCPAGAFHGTEDFSAQNRTFISTHPSGALTFVFRSDGSNVFSGWEASIDCVDAPTCFAPLTPITSNHTSSSTVLSWTSDDILFEINWGTGNFDAGDGANTIVNATNNFLLENLTPNTTYRYYVRTQCADDETSQWKGPVTFTTHCLSTTIPYLMDFESAIVPALPNCTLSQNLGSGNNFTVAAANTTYGFTSKHLRYAWSTLYAANAWFYTQGIELEANTTYTISYKYGSTGTTYPEKLAVAYGTSPTATDMTNSLATHDNIVNNMPNTNTINFTPTEDDVYYFGFKAFSNMDQFYLMVDDISVDIALSTDKNNDISSFKVYPNPVKDILTISHEKNIDKVEIYNLIGQKLLTFNQVGTNPQLDLNQLATGTYLLKVYADAKTKTVKVIKK